MQSVGLKSCPGCLHRQLQASQPLRLQQRRPIAQRAQPRLISAESTRGTATLPVRDTQGEDVGSVELSLKVAGDDTAKGLVHRYLVMARQNARSVSRCIRGSMILEPASRTRAARCACAGTYCRVPGQTRLNPEPGFVLSGAATVLFTWVLAACHSRLEHKCGPPQRRHRRQTCEVSNALTCRAQPAPRRVQRCAVAARSRTRRRAAATRGRAASARRCGQAVASSSAPRYCCPFKKRELSCPLHNAALSRAAQRLQVTRNVLTNLNTCARCLARHGADW